MLVLLVMFVTSLSLSTRLSFPTRKAANRAVPKLGNLSELVTTNIPSKLKKKQKNSKFIVFFIKNQQTAHAVLVPGGFGVRGVGGKLAAIKYARENRVPYLGICLGMQLAVVEAD